MRTLRFVCAVVAQAFAMGALVNCGGKERVAQVQDAPTQPAADAGDAGPLTCTIVDGRCVASTELCCEAPMIARVVDLANKCVSKTLTPLGCMHSPGPPHGGCIVSTTPRCLMRPSPDGGQPDVFFAPYYWSLSDLPGFQACPPNVESAEREAEGQMCP